MPAVPKPKTPISSVIATQAGHELLTPIVAFLLKSGVSPAQLQAEIRSAIHRASASKLKVSHVSFGHDSTSIVNRWLRDPNYLNKAGRPDELPLNGSRSIESLVEACHTAVSPSAALKMLLEFGVVRKVTSSKYRLVRRLMDYGHSEHLPFEPNFRFLVDATKVSTRRLRNARKAPGLFWQCADNPRIDSRLAREFLRFAQQRSLSFMHEINDWLDEHECVPSNSISKRIQLKRLGVGLFGICR